ncbi:hypothetical protein J437_LFUL013091 [Ladona fulva]|uniref:HTH psq-type domain-containing protein n=1 Tax=Ladona fulva TaxID=123851 RepID=A0A8K0P472_LADFU|nr:hypothetical protein J437_LFUL013091 [Ladona fulva]
MEHVVCPRISLSGASSHAFSAHHHHLPPAFDSNPSGSISSSASSSNPVSSHISTYPNPAFPRIKSGGIGNNGSGGGRGLGGGSSFTHHYAPHYYHHSHSSNSPVALSSQVSPNSNQNLALTGTTVRRKRTNTQTDENFLSALEAVRTGGVGFCKAARMYGVNNRTLWLEYKKRGYPITRPSVKARTAEFVLPNPPPPPPPPPTSSPLHVSDRTQTVSTHPSCSTAVMCSGEGTGGRGGGSGDGGGGAGGGGGGGDGTGGSGGSAGVESRGREEQGQMNYINPVVPVPHHLSPRGFEQRTNLDTMENQARRFPTGGNVESMFIG